MKITKVYIEVGHTFGPKYQPMKASVGYEVEIQEGQNAVDVKNALKAVVSDELWNLSIDELTKFKGAEEAAAFKKERE